MDDFAIALRNYSGVPVVEFAGEINRKALSNLEDMLKSLVSAGHCNAMLNVKKATWRSISSLTRLNKIAGLFRSHYGILDIIADETQISAIRSARLRIPAVVQFCTSERQALARMRKLPEIWADEARAMPAHIARS
ncbi:MAG: hypothetical protein ACYC2Y_09055 [Armatimonadota bacterium]